MVDLSRSYKAFMRDLTLAIARSKHQRQTEEGVPPRNSKEERGLRRFGRMGLGGKKDVVFGCLVSFCRTGWFCTPPDYGSIDRDPWFSS